jgi:predicted transcriptional regulator
MLARSIQFRDGLYERLTESADNRQVSTQWLINQLLEEGLERLATEIKVTT